MAAYYILFTTNMSVISSVKCCWRLIPNFSPVVVSVQMVQMFSHCVLGSVDEMDLDELFATKLVTFMMEHHNTIFQVPSKLRHQVEEHLSHLKRVQVSTLSEVTIHLEMSPCVPSQMKTMCQIGSIILPNTTYGNVVQLLLPILKQHKISISGTFLC